MNARLWAFKDSFFGLSEQLFSWLLRARVSSSLLHHFTGALPSPPQLTNWIKYLDYMEGKGVTAATVVIYERCLVPCASYPGERATPQGCTHGFLSLSLSFCLSCWVEKGEQSGHTRVLCFRMSRAG